MQLQERPVLDHLGVESAFKTWHNLPPAELYEHAIRGEEGTLVSTGAFTAETGQHTGRSPKDKFLVKEPSSESRIWWKGGNRPISPEKFDALLDRMVKFCAAHPVYVQDVFACAEPSHRLRVRVVTEYAWHSLFVNNLFIRPTAEERADFSPDFTVMSLPSVKADPQAHGTR